MRNAATVFAGIVGALALVALIPISAYAGPDTIFSKMVPSETQAVDTSGPAFVATPSDHYMDVSESQKVDTSGPAFVVTPANDYAAGSLVARMAPSETQKVDTTGPSEPQAVAKTPGSRSGKCAGC